MRDPNRIKRILDLLEIIWKKYPDIRLCQLLSNTAYSYSEWQNNDLFYFEDYDLEKSLIKGMEENE